jgi:hypothetical protein
VARAVSSLQKVRSRKGEILGVLEAPDGTLRSGPYRTLLRELLDGRELRPLVDFILTAGVVSNHGNWFTLENHNKELRVLAQSYDWLLFLTDEGLGRFIQHLLLEPAKDLTAVREAFHASYSRSASGTRFTKVRMDVDADAALRTYFFQHAQDLDGWFNVISPVRGTLRRLRSELGRLRGKRWKELLGQ